MQVEHLAVAKLLERIRAASDEFTLPEWACNSYNTLFSELKQQMIAAGLARPVPFDFDEGAEVIVQGNFTRRAANGQANSSGLLEYASHTTVTPAPPPTPARR